MAKKAPKVARIMHAKMKRSKLKEAMKKWGPYTSGYYKQKGFHSGIMLVDEKTGEVYSMTFWDSMAAIRANERSAYIKHAVGQFVPYFTRKPYSTYHKVGAFVPPKAKK
jgi:heme-degrading monooxygenase HmoA